MNTWVYVHDLSPFAIKFTEQVGVRWYGLAYIVGFFLSYWLIRWQVNNDWCECNLEQLEDLVLTVALWGIIGGRAGYVFLYGMEYFMEDPFYLFRVWEGGMSIHGGVLTAVGGIGWFAYKHDYSFWELSDAAALSTPPGLFLGRIANFINGELWGRPTAGDWGVIFPDAANFYGGTPVPRHPSQLYEAMLEGALLFFILWLIRITWDSLPAGVLSMSFLGGYSVMRFVVEFYRAPDPHLGFEWMHLTRGQLYSVFFLGLAVAISVWLWTEVWRTGTTR